MIKKIAVACFSILLVACTHASTISTVTGPSIASKSVLVIAAIDPRLDQIAERRFAQTLGAEGYSVQTGVVWMSRHSVTSAEDWKSQVRADGFDTVVILGGVAEGKTAVKLPDTYYPGQTTSSGVVTGNTVSITSTTTPGTYVPGETFYKPWANFSANIIDAATFRPAFVASIDTRGSVFNSRDALAERAADELLSEAQKSGFLEPLNGASSKGSSWLPW
ncbi:MAG: hypothetical protein GC190_16050 [Alphaproteobacteria bacterium]|nr:hypothetical protein [Alphaproteobacteria bacterium]